MYAVPGKNSGSHYDNPFFALLENTTAADATAEIRQLADVEMVFYVYVIYREKTHCRSDCRTVKGSGHQRYCQSFSWVNLY